MTRHSLLTHKLLVGSMLSALLLAPFSPAFAEDSGLFPTKSKASHAPDYLPDLAPAAGVADAAPSQGPLRVVIPNIHAEKRTTNHTGGSEKKIAAAQAPAIRTAPADDKTTEITAVPTQTITASALDQISRALFAKAQEAWNNGVFLAEWSKAGIIRTILKPNITFSSIPTDWRLTVTASNDASMVANLSPAAGGDPAKIDAPAQPLIPTVIRTPDAAAAPVPVQPDTQVTVPVTAAAANTAPAAEASEPAPELSSQSKTIANKIPAVRDAEPEKPLAKKVDIERNKEVTGDVLNSAKPTAVASASTNIKPGDRPKFDVNYELQRAYDALIAGKSDIAIQIYQDILTGNPKNKDALFGLASTYHRAGQIDMARTLYGKLLAIDPKNRDGLNNFLVLLADEAPQEALQQMQKLEDQNPDFSPIPAQMAIIYQKLGDTDKAVDKMYRALAIAPENITYRYNLAIMLDKNGKYDQAGKLYTQILDSHAKGEVIPGDPTKIQQRLTFIRSNTLK